MFKLKRVYEEPSPDDGFRVLVERLWPRGVSKETRKSTFGLRTWLPLLTSGNGSITIRQSGRTFSIATSQS